MEDESSSKPSFGARLSTAFACFGRALSSPEFCLQVASLLRPDAARRPVESAETKPAEAKPVATKPVEIPPEKLHASGLAVLAMLQREGRLIDFLQEEVAAFSDADVGAAARVVHAGCRKAFKEHFTIEPVLEDAEGAAVQIPAGFDANRIRITGNVAGQPPFRGTLKHHGWVVTAIHLPSISEAIDAKVIATAEVEL